MTFKQGDRVLVRFPRDTPEWVEGVVVRDEDHGWVGVHIERPASLRSLPNMSGPKPLVSVRSTYVKKADQ